MKRLSIKIMSKLTIISFLFIVLWMASAFAEDKTYNLSFTTIYMDKHPTVQNAFFPWMKDVEKLSNGRIKMTYFNPNTLCPAQDNYDSTVNGVVDISGQYCGQNPGKFPLNEAMELPMIVPGSEAGSLLTWALYNEFPDWQNEYKDIKILWQWASATYQLHTKTKLVKKVEDLKGMKIIGWSPKLLDMLKALGASPLQISPTDTYLALERGMADGVLCPLAPVRSYKISDAVKYHTIIDINVGPFWAGINKQVWDELPADLQKIMVDTTGAKLARESGKSLDEGAMIDAQWMKSLGHTFYVVPEDEKVLWFSKLQNMHENWVIKMEEKGYKNARAILNEAVKLGKEYGKTTGRGFTE